MEIEQNCKIGQGILSKYQETYNEKDYLYYVKHIIACRECIESLKLESIELLKEWYNI